MVVPNIPELAAIRRRRKGGSGLSNMSSQAMTDTSTMAIAQNTIATLSAHLIELLGLRHVARLKMPKIELPQSKISDAVNRNGNGGVAPLLEEMLAITVISNPAQLANAALIAKSRALEYGVRRMRANTGVNMESM